MADLNLDATTLLICCEVYQRYISACGLHSRQSVSAVISEDGRIEAERGQPSLWEEWASTEQQNVVVLIIFQHSGAAGGIGGQC